MTAFLVSLNAKSIVVEPVAPVFIIDVVVVVEREEEEEGHGREDNDIEK